VPPPGGQALGEFAPVQKDDHRDYPIGADELGEVQAIVGQAVDGEAPRLPKAPRYVERDPGRADDTRRCGLMDRRLAGGPDRCPGRSGPAPCGLEVRARWPRGSAVCWGYPRRWNETGHRVEKVVCPGFAITVASDEGA